MLTCCLACEVYKYSWYIRFKISLMMFLYILAEWRVRLTSFPSPSSLFNRVLSLLNNHNESNCWQSCCSHRCLIPGSFCIFNIWAYVIYLSLSNTYKKKVFNNDGSIYTYLFLILDLNYLKAVEQSEAVLPTEVTRKKFQRKVLFCLLKRLT